jgi:hypothetical protein
MVILDDHILAQVKAQLKEDVKPAVLLESLLSMAKTKLPLGTGSIASLLKNDVSLGLEDPFDERATFSREEMTKWEEEWTNTRSPQKESSLPLVVFVRTDASQGLLKSKSAVEYLQQECTSSDSIHLLVLGKGMDLTTPPQQYRENETPPQQQQSMDNQGAAWFGFSPQNQNASGQNDPEGSRRFNIFLARTVDAQGTPGILGAIAQPQAGNLFPHIMAMQARERMQESDETSPIKAELERWAQMLQQQQQQAGAPPPQFFNASLAPGASQYTPPPLEAVQQALQQAMTELLDRVAQSVGDESPELHQTFAQVLQNENLRRGIAENLARAAPALSDPKCQGVMLSVYVPPPVGRLPGSSSTKPPGGWFQKILNHNEDDDDNSEEDEPRSRKDRVRTMAATVASMAGDKNNKSNAKAERNLAKLESLCRHITIKTPSDPVRQKSWEAWIARERGAVTFAHNRRALNEELVHRNLSLEKHTGTRGAGSALRQMLSFRDISGETEDVVKCAVELEAAKSRRQEVCSFIVLRDYNVNFFVVSRIHPLSCCRNRTRMLL